MFESNHTLQFAVNMTATETQHRDPKLKIIGRKWSATNPTQCNNTLIHVVTFTFKRQRGKTKSNYAEMSYIQMQNQKGKKKCLLFPLNT